MTRPAVYLHVGAPKTGTTFLQRSMWQNRATLRQAGILYPGAVPQLHFRASLDLRGAPWSAHESAAVAGSWRKLVAQVRKWDGGAAVVSHESFSKANKSHIARAMADLDFADVHVIYTDRDLARQLPAAWQERLKNASTLTFGEFLTGVRATPAGSEIATGFWRIHDAHDVLTRWGAALPREQLHLVTVPPAGSPPELLWQRFCSVFGADAENLSTATDIANTSLGAAEAAVLRQVNEQVADRGPADIRYIRTVKHVLAPVLAARRGEPIGLPEDVYEWAVQRAERNAERLRGAGFDIVGDLKDLIPAADRPGADPDDMPAAAIAAAATRATALAVRALIDPDSQLAPADRRPARPVEEAKRWLLNRAAHSARLTAAYERYRSLRRRGAR